MPPQNTVVMEGVQIIFRNFAGKEGQYNQEGSRNFGVILPEELAEALVADGWNVKYLKPREEDEDDTETPWLPVAARWDAGKPPKITVITERGKTVLDENMVEMLDYVDIAVDEDGEPKVDMIVKPSRWEVGGRTGLKAYLQSMYITIEEDELEKKYSTMDSQ